MKVPIYDSELGWLGTIPLKIIKVEDASSGLQRVTVRVPALKVFDIIRPKPRPHPQPASPVAPAKTPAAGTTADKPSPKTAKTPPPTADTGRHIEITLTIPRLPKPSQIPRVLWRFLWMNRRVSGVIGIALVAIVASYIVTHRSAPAIPTNGKTTGPPPLVKGTPGYATVLPAGKTIADYGGWTRISPPNRDPVYAYVDKVGTAQINVSEQPLPASFASNTEAQVSQLAQRFNATDKFTVANTPVYVSTSSDGEQSVILSKAGLLILIKSNAPLTNNQWAAYINTLR